MTSPMTSCPSSKRNVIIEEHIQINDLRIDVVRKDIKNMHLAVYPPTGRLRLSAPNKTDEEVLRLFAISKISWMRKHIKNFEEQERESPREFISGESHYLFGKRYILELEEGKRNGVRKKGHKKLILTIRPNHDLATRTRVMREWYRSQLKGLLPELIQQWEKVIGVKAKSWGVRRMSTKWGACNIDNKRIWLNLELAKKPTICLEYIIAHELIHLHERHHNERFIELMNRFMPKWRQHRKTLSELPVAHEEWGY